MQSHIGFMSSGLKCSPAILLGVTKIDGCPVISMGVDAQPYDDECLLIRFHFSLGKLSKTPEGLCKEVGIHLYASGSTSKVGGLNRDPCEERKSLGFGGGVSVELPE